METTSSGATSPKTARVVPSSSAWVYALLRRTHFYAGILIAPFIFVAAATGALYAVAPQVEKVVYRQVLTAPGSATRLSLDEQVAAANAYKGQGALIAVRPAVEPGTTTRVMYADDSLPESTSQAVFVDPSQRADFGGVRGLRE